MTFEEGCLAGDQDRVRNRVQQIPQVLVAWIRAGRARERSHLPRQHRKSAKKLAQLGVRESMVTRGPLAR